MQLLIFIGDIHDNDIHSYGSATTPMVLSDAAIEDLKIGLINLQEVLTFISRESSK
jgi:hypothetical protein